MKALIGHCAVFAALSLAGAGSAGAAEPSGGDGYLAAPRLGDFQIGFTEGNERGSITEEIPRGESVEHWTRMITTQRFTGLARHATAMEYLAVVARDLPGSCPRAQMTVAEALTVSGRPAARLRADCPQNPQSRQPETFFILAVQGPDDMHVKQVAFARVPDADDVRWAGNVLGGISYCAPLSQAPECRLSAGESP
ncbi:hypothetical protein [Novosphingobium lentum]|uniref:hypothetical protein n=1 Tax=Novosphingobium lentum TaxID=145287 RepID=UPI000AB65849|nr:hypothetical protein [Novosphingobium lentum]